MEYKQITKEELLDLFKKEIIVFENEGIKMAFEKGQELIESKTIESFIKEKNISEESIIVNPFSQEKINFENLTNEEKDLYIDYWVKRMVFFHNIDYMWEKETLEEVNVLELENNILTTQSNIEILLSKNNIYVPTHLVVENNVEKQKVKNFNDIELEKYHTIKYALNMPDLSLIAVVKNEDYYFKEIKGFNRETNFSNIISCVKNLLKLEDMNFLRVMDAVENDRDELSSETDINIFLKNINKCFERNKIKSFDLSEYSPQLYSGIFDHNISYRNDSKYDVELEILNDLFERYFTIFIKYNMGVKATSDENENLITINEKNLHLKKIRLMDMVNKVLGGYEFIPDLTYEIDPYFDKNIFYQNTSEYAFRRNFSVSRNGDKVTVASKRNTTLLKDTVIEALNFIGSENILANRVKNFSFNGVSKENMNATMFGLVTDILKNYVVKNESEEEQEKFKLLMLAFQASVFTHNMPDVYKMHFQHLKNFEFISLLDKCDIKQKLYYFLFNENYNVHLVDLIAVKDIKQAVNQQAVTAIPYFTQTKEINAIANEWLRLIINKDNWTFNKIAEMVGVKESNLLKYNEEYHYRRDRITSIAEAYSMTEEIKIEKETVNSIIEFKQNDYTGFLSTSEKKEIFKSINKGLLQTMIEMGISENVVNEYLEDNDRVRIKDRAVFEYFMKKGEIITQNLENFDPCMWVEKNQKKEIVNVFADIVKLEEKPMFKKSDALDLVHEMLAAAFKLDVFTEKEQIFLLEKFYKKEYFSTNMDDEYVNSFLKLNLSENVLKTLIKCNVDFIENRLDLFNNFFADLKVFCINNKNEHLLDYCKEEITLKIKEYKIAYVTEVAGTISKFYDTDTEKMNFLIESMIHVKNKRKSYNEVNLKDYSKIFDPNNKRVFKIILKKFNDELLNIKDFFEKINVEIEINHINEKNEEETPEEVLSVKLKILSSIISYFSPNFIYEKEWVNTILNISKLTNDLHQLINKPINKEEKSLLGMIYWKLPEDLAQLSVDKLEEGKLLHQLMGEIKLIKYMEEKEDEKLVKKKKKI